MHQMSQQCFPATIVIYSPGAMMVTSPCQHCLFPGNIFFDSFSQEISLRHVQSKGANPPLTFNPLLFLYFICQRSPRDSCIPASTLLIHFMRLHFLFVKKLFLDIYNLFLKCTHRISLTDRQVEGWIDDR